MEIIADLHTKKGVIHLHFHAWGIPSDGFTWSPDCTKEEKLEALKEFREYLAAEIDSLEGSRLTMREADDGDSLAESELSNDEMDDTFEII